MSEILESALRDAHSSVSGRRHDERAGAGAHGPRFLVRKAAVLGAGVMGAQIAAHLVNANVETLLFELPAKEGDPKGAAPHDSMRPTRRCLDLRLRCREAGR